MTDTKEYYDEKGNHIIETSDGYLIINGSVVAEPGTDKDFDRYAVEVQNGDGFYSSDGHFVRFRDDDYA